MPQVINLSSTCPKVLVLAGSNATSIVTESLQLVRDAVREVQNQDFEVDAVSAYYTTPCFPAGLGPDFVNVAFSVKTELMPDDLLQFLHGVEQRFGRERPSRWAPRTLDLDLIAYGDVVLPDEIAVRRWIDLPVERQKQDAPDRLILPHPRVHERAFALIPLLDIAPDWRHPILGKTVREMVDALPDGDKNGVQRVAG